MLSTSKPARAPGRLSGKYTRTRAAGPTIITSIPQQAAVQLGLTPGDIIEWGEEVVRGERRIYIVKVWVLPRTEGAGMTIQA